MDEIEIPSVPNFVNMKLYGQEVKVPVDKLTENDIKHICDRWSIKFRDHCKAMKENRRKAGAILGEMRNP